MFGIDDIIGGIAKIGGTLIDRLVPDENQRAAEKATFELEVQKEVNAALADQRDINKTEAASSSMFVAGWRPAVGWVCVTALFCYYVPYMLVLTGLWTWLTVKMVLLACTSAAGCESVALPPRPDLGITDLLGLLMSLLGIGTMRTVEKIQGVDSAVASPAGALGFVKGLFK